MLLIFNSSVDDVKMFDLVPASADGEKTWDLFIATDEGYIAESKKKYNSYEDVKTDITKYIDEIAKNKCFDFRKHSEIELY